MAPIHGVPSAGEVVGGKYILRECIGEGGMGIVFLADHASLGRKVAIKLLQPALATCDTLVRRFHTEAVAACRVQHPGSVAIIDCGTTDDGTPFIAMEHVRGSLLSAVIAEEEISLPRALRIIQQLLRILEAAHANGVIHADIKSDNIIVEHTADGDAITLIDFGLARIEGQEDHDHGHGNFVSGTPEYMAPELVRGEPSTIATDLYGVGVMLYELLTGQTPFEGGSTEEILLRHIEDEVVPPSKRRLDRHIPAVLDQIVLRALHKDPRERFANAGELARALAAVPREGAPLDPATVQLEDPYDLIVVSRPGCAPRAQEAPTSHELPRLLHEAPLKRAS